MSAGDFQAADDQWLAKADDATSDRSRFTDVSAKGNNPV